MNTVKRVALAALPVLRNRAVVLTVVSAAVTLAGYAVAPDKVGEIATIISTIADLAGTP